MMEAYSFQVPLPVMDDPNDMSERLRRMDLPPGVDFHRMGGTLLFEDRGLNPNDPVKGYFVILKTVSASTKEASAVFGPIGGKIQAAAELLRANQ